MSQVDVYTRDYCGFCVRAVHLLREKGIEFTEHNATRDPAKREEMIARSGRRTFPQIFIGDFHVGGSDDLMAFERSGKLDETIKAML